MQVKGVDISEFNGSVDFQALKNAGVKFVIIRTGFGSDYPGQQDKRFAENVQKAEAAGMPWGVYHYAYATTRQGGIDEAKHCLRLLNGKKPAYGVWYDMEDNATLGGDLAGAADGFCSTVEAAGLYTGVYASVSWWKNNLTSSIFDKYDRWVAQYYSVCQCTKPYGIWQYTDKWSIGGRDFDGNFAYKDYPALTGGVRPDDPGEDNKEDDDMTEAQVKTIAEKAIADYFASLEKKPVSDWAEEAVEYAKAEGLMNGDTNGNFRPQSPITREEVAAVLKNAFDK